MRRSTVIFAYAVAVFVILGAVALMAGLLMLLEAIP